MKTYLYPQNLKARANLWLWSLRDFVILCAAVLVSAVIFLNSGFALPAALALCFGFLTIRKDDKPETVKDRLATYHAETEPLKGFYEARGILSSVENKGSIDATNAAVMEVLTK